MENRWVNCTPQDVWQEIKLRFNLADCEIPGEPGSKCTFYHLRLEDFEKFERELANETQKT